MGDAVAAGGTVGLEHGAGHLVQPEPKTTDSFCSCERYSACRFVPASHRTPRTRSASAAAGGTLSQPVRATSERSAVWAGISFTRGSPRRLAVSSAELASGPPAAPSLAPWAWPHRVRTAVVNYPSQTTSRTDKWRRARLAK